MKKAFLFLATAAVIGVGSAFASVNSTDEQIYVSVNGVMTPIEEASGRCVSQPNQHCKFYLDENNQYQPLPGDLNQKWQ